MALDVEKTLFHSGLNSFKNVNVHRHVFQMPNTHTANVADILTHTFTLSEDADFTQLLVKATDYGKYFRYRDSKYHNTWMMIEQSLDFLLLDTPVTQLFFFKVTYKVDGDQVTVQLKVNPFGTTFNIDPEMEVPIAFVEYTLAR